MPYAPGISYHGDQYLYSALSDLGSSAAAAITYNKDRAHRQAQLQATLDALNGYGDEDQDPNDADDQGGGTAGAGGQPTATDEQGPMDDQGNPTTSNAPEALQQRGKQARALRNLLTSYNPGVKDHVDAMSVDELEGTLKGITLAQAAQEHQARMRDYAAQASMRKQNVADDQSIGAALNRYANAPGVSDEAAEDGQRPPTEAERFRYALATPGLAGRAVPKLIDSLTKYGQVMQNDEGGAIQVTKDSPYPGVALIRTRNGAVHVVQDPSTQGQPVVDPSTGAVVPNMIMTRSGPRAIPQPKAVDPALVAQRQQQANKLWMQNARQAEDDLDYANKKLAKLKPSDPEYAAAKQAVDAAQAKHDQIMTTGPGAATAAAPSAAGKTGGNAQLTPKQRQDLIAQANAAIQSGADPVKVKARLKEKYGIVVQ